MSSGQEHRGWWCVKIPAPVEALDELILVIHDMNTLGAAIEEQGGTVWVSSYWPHESQIKEIVRKLEEWRRELNAKGQVFPLIGLEIEALEDGAWEETWRKYFRPRKVSPRIVVTPPWGKVKAKDGVCVIQINPGRAFGTGLHETTRMCLRWLDDILSGPYLPPRALDLGTGSGILAIAMAKLGVEDVWAVDLDPVAVLEAQENVEANGVREKVRILEGDIGVVEGMGFPLIVANLTTEALMRMASTIGTLAEPGGVVVVSGILEGQQRSVAKVFGALGFRSLGSKRMGEWKSLFMKRQ